MLVEHFEVMAALKRQCRDIGSYATKMYVQGAVQKLQQARHVASSRIGSICTNANGRRAAKVIWSSTTQQDLADSIGERVLSSC